MCSQCPLATSEQGFSANTVGHQCPQKRSSTSWCPSPWQELPYTVGPILWVQRGTHPGEARVPGEARGRGKRLRAPHPNSRPQQVCGA